MAKSPKDRPDPQFDHDPKKDRRDAPARQRNPSDMNPSPGPPDGEEEVDDPRDIDEEEDEEGR